MMNWKQIFAFKNIVLRGGGINKGEINKKYIINFK